MVAIWNKPVYACYEQFLEKFKIINNDMFTFCIREKESWVIWKRKNAEIVTEKKAFLLDCSENELINIINNNIMKYHTCTKYIFSMIKD